MADGITSLGASELDRSFFGRSGDIYNQPGLREYLRSPAQGQQFNTISREASRNLFNSIIRPSDWRSTLGVQPAADYNYRLDTGGYAPGGSVRARTGLSGIDLRAPRTIGADYQLGSFGDTAFGGKETSFDFNFEDQAPEIIARAGNIGAVAKDRSGMALSQAPYSFEQPLEFSRQSEADFGRFGSGSFTDTGRASAKLQSPSGGFDLNNQIYSTVGGSGQSRTREFSGGEGLNLAEEYSKVGSTGQFEELATKFGIAVASKLVSMGITSALTAAQLAALTNPATALVGLATLPISYFGGKAAGRLASKYRTDKLTDTTARAESGLGSLTDVTSEGPGTFDFTRQAAGQANVINPSVTGYGMTASDVYSGLGQQAGMQLGQEARGKMRLGADISGVADTILKEHETVKKSAGNWDPNKSYTAHAGSEQSQQATLLGQANITNQAQMARQTVPESWVSQNIDPQMLQNFQTYKDRYPGLYGNYSNIDDFITREYFRQNPQAAAQFNQQANIETISNATATPMYQDIPFKGLDYQKRGNLGVDAGGSISLSGPGEVDITNLADIATRQRTTPQAGAFGTTLGYNTQSVINAQLNSQLNATLSGAGAQADAINQLKFNFNDEEYGATLQLNAQRFINNLEEQMPQTRDSQLFINSLRNNPELTALFEQGLAPETIVKATLDYDKVNNEFKNQLEWEQNQNYQQAQVYDPTPDQPNSGDEVSLANVFGNVRQIDPGKLYDIQYKDVLGYNTDYKLPTPLTSVSNEYLADQYNWNQDLANSMYYYTPGQSELYNTLANEFINRRYDLTDQYDTTAADQYLQQIAGLQAGQGLEGYSYEDLQNIQNLLQQERQYDIEGAPSLSGRIDQSYYLPETVNIDPSFKYTVEGVGGGKYKGFYQDPRSGEQLANADVLEKYFDYSKWAPGQKLQDEMAHLAGMAPGMEGAGSKIIDPLTGQPLTAAREMTPEEFAEAQIKRSPEDYTWQAQQYDPLIEKAQIGVEQYYKPSSYYSVSNTPYYRPMYEETQTGWTPSDEYQTRTFSEAPTLYNTSGLSGGAQMPIYRLQGGLFGGPTQRIFQGYSNQRLPYYATNPDYLNYSAYQSALSNEIQNYLAQNNLNIPV